MSSILLRKLILTGFVSMVSVGASAQAIRCEQAHGDITLGEFKKRYFDKTQVGPDPQLNGALKALENIDSELILGQATPKWSDFESLRLIRESLQDGIQKLRESSGEKAVQKFYQGLDSVYSKFNRQRQYESASQLPNNFNYGEIDYGLRAAYRSELEKLNSILPSQMRFVLKELPKDIKKEKLKQQAQEVVTELEDQVRKLYGTSGYQDVRSLVDTIAKKGSEQVQFNLKHLLDEDFEFAIARPQNARWWVPKVGFHNQHITGSSGGANDPQLRNLVEASRLSITYDDFATQDNDLKPKYGWMIPKLDSGYYRADVHYGEDYFILDKEKLRKRTTWTPSDSLNTIHQWIQWGTQKASTPDHWEKLFVPWSQRALLAPVLADMRKRGLTADFPTNYSRYSKDKSIYKVGPGAPDFFRAFGKMEYVELQYWGPVTLDDVKSYVFRGKAPDGEFLEELIKRKIPIYQVVSTNEYKKWAPGDSK